ncbi:MAG: acetate--CoA ligase family protein [Parcubacteria group bacterium]
MQDLNNLFNPKSIAIVGASEEEGKVGNVVAKNILTLGYRGNTFLVNPKHDTLFDQKCYKNLNEVDGQVDLAIIIIPAKFVNEVVKASADKIKNYIVISAGFGEINDEGKKREEELRQVAEKNNLNILGPNCLGFIIPSLKLNASFAGGLPEAGNIAFVTQSGALAVAMMDAAKNYDFKFSQIISIGNKMQIDEAGLLEYLEKDEKTKVIGLYLEGIKDGQKFVEIARNLSKPVVVLKAGKTEKAQKAIVSHTGALAGSAEITNAVFKNANIIQAETLEEFFNLLHLISFCDAPFSPEVAVVTNAGGAGVLTTDAFFGKILKLSEFPEEAKKHLRQFLPEESSVENPVDLLGDAREDRYEQALEVINWQKNTGAVICVLTPQDQTPVGRIATRIIEFQKKTKKVVAACFIGGERVEIPVTKLRFNNIPCFSFPGQAVSALDKYYQWNISQVEASPRLGLAEINVERKNRVLEIIQRVKSEKRGALLFSEAKEVMEMYGVKTANFWTEISEDIIYPVVVKIDSDKVLHKTDKQGLILNIKNQEELKIAIEKIKANFPGENIIIQPMQQIQTELIVGVKIDGAFGSVVVYGLGGIYTEVFKMVDFLVSPCSQKEIEKSLKESKIKFLFEATRGQKPYNLEEMAGILWGVSCLAREIAEIKELDINPLLVYNDGKEAVAVDVKIIM